MLRRLAPKSKLNFSFCIYCNEICDWILLLSNLWHTCKLYKVCGIGKQWRAARAAGGKYFGYYPVNYFRFRNTFWTLFSIPKTLFVFILVYQVALRDVMWMWIALSILLKVPFSSSQGTKLKTYAIKSTTSSSSGNANRHQAKWNDSLSLAPLPLSLYLSLSQSKAKWAKVKTYFS